jgi:putative nucleotidyltransferase with HDIG domain
MRSLATILGLGQSPAAEHFHAEGQTRALQPLGRRERVGETITSVAFVAVVAGLLVASQGHLDVDLPLALALVAALAVVSRIEFDVGTGYTVPAQLVFVPMLFLLPPALVPPAVVAAFVLAQVPDVLRHRRPASRMFLSLGDSWFAVGPAAVLILAGWPTVSDVGLPLALAVLGAQFVVDFLACTCRELIVRGVSLMQQLRDVVWVYTVDALLAPIGFLAALAAEKRPALVLLVLSLAVLLRLFAFERAARLANMVELGHAYRGTAVLLGDVVEADHEYTGSHSRGVVDLATAVADQLGLGSVQRRNIEFGALLHDVGKIAIPKQIIDKPGPLDDEEWAIMRTHTIAGEDMLRTVGGVLADVGRIVRASHESFDGSGYPDGLAGSDIPIEARIVACCDAYSAMTTDRPYRPARTRMDAIDELRRCSGTQFDPAVVEALLTVLRLLPPEPVQFDELPLSVPASPQAVR